jgi:hypothetical protein
MRKPKVGANFTIFLIFFGIATLEVFQRRNWYMSAFWLAIAVAFWLAGSQKKDDLKNI